MVTLRAVPATAPRLSGDQHRGRGLLKPASGREGEHLEGPHQLAPWPHQTTVCV